MDEWTEILDAEESIDVLYMDFMKALDKVSHRRLIKKIKRYGIGDQIISWIEDFLQKSQLESNCKWIRV